MHPKPSSSASSPLHSLLHACHQPIAYKPPSREVQKLRRTIFSTETFACGEDEHDIGLKSDCACIGYKAILLKYDDCECLNSSQAQFGALSRVMGYSTEVSLAEATLSASRRIT